MSLESSIAELLDEVSETLALPQGIYDAAAGRMTALAAAYQSYVTAQTVTMHVHGVAGNDANSGAADAPLKTIGAAIAKGIKGGMVRVRLMSDIMVGADITVSDLRVVISSNDSVRYRLSFERYVRDISGSVTRAVYGFNLTSCHLEFTGLTIVQPALDGSWPNYVVGATSSIARVATGGVAGWVVMKIYLCDLEVPTAVFANLLVLAPTTLAGLYLATVVTTGQPYLGKLLNSATNVAGVDPNTIRGLVSNLTLV